MLHPTEEAIDYTDSVDPEVTIEDAYYMPGHRQELLTLKEATKRCFIHQGVVVIDYTHSVDPEKK